MINVKEGTLYKLIEIDGVCFNIYYGYECEGERLRGWEPEPIYPDFKKNPIYNNDGKQFALTNDEICELYLPISITTECICCANCKHFILCEDIIGICNARKEK